MTPSERRTLLATVAGCIFVTYGCFLFLTPLYPTVARDLHLGADQLGLIVGSASVMSAILQIPVGVASDRFGRRPFLFAGLLLTTIAQILRWQSGNPVTFTAGWLAVGLSLPLTASASYAAVADAYSDSGSGRAQALGTVTASISLGQIAGFLVTVVVGQSVSWRTLSLWLAGFPALLLVPVLLMREPGRQSTPRGFGSTVLDALRFLFARTAGALAAIGALALGAGISATYLLPFALRADGLGVRESGLYLLPYVAGAILGPPLIGRLADRTGSRAPMLACLGAGLVAEALFALTGARPLAVLVLFFVLGATLASVLSLAANEIVALVQGVSTTGTAAALGGLRLGQAAGPSLGPAISGLVYTRAGFGAAFATLAAALAVALGLALLALRSPDAFQDRA